MKVLKVRNKAFLFNQVEFFEFHVSSTKYHRIVFDITAILTVYLAWLATVSQQSCRCRVRILLVAEFLRLFLPNDDSNGHFVGHYFEG